MTWTTDDNVMAQLRSWLVEQGFVVLSDRYESDSFGNQDVVLTRPIAIRLVRDREEWAVLICGPEGAWLPLGQWVNQMTGTGPGPISAADQDSALRALLPEVEQHGRGSRDPDASG